MGRVLWYVNRVQTPQSRSLRYLLDFLLNKGVGAANKDGVVPLMLALKNNLSIDIIKTLAKNSPPNHVDNAGQGYFQYLLSSHCIINVEEFCEKCDILMELGSSIGAKDISGKSPIVHLMEQYHNFYCEFNFVRMFRFFKEHGMDLHAKDDRDRNIVLCVLDNKITDHVLPLLQFFQSIGLDLKLIDSNGRNALDHLFANILYNYVNNYDKIPRLNKGLLHNNTEREFLEVLKEIHDFLTDDIGLLPTTVYKNGLNAVMLALENCAGWIIDVLKLDIPLNEDDKGRKYFT